MTLLAIGKNSNICQHFKNIFHHKNLAFEQEGNGRQNGTTIAIPPTCISNSKSYTSNEDVIGVDDDFNHRSLMKFKN
jgi:hypothetical protein